MVELQQSVVDVNLTGVTTTGENLGGFKRLVGAASSTVVSIAVVKAAAKTSDHRYFGQGSQWILF